MAAQKFLQHVAGVAAISGENVGEEYLVRFNGERRKARMQLHVSPQLDAHAQHAELTVCAVDLLQRENAFFPRQFHFCTSFSARIFSMRSATRSEA